MQPHGDGVYRNLHRLVHPHGRGLRHASDQRRIQRRPDARSGYGIDLSRRHRATPGSQFHVDVRRLLADRDQTGARHDVHRDSQRRGPGTGTTPTGTVSFSSSGASKISGGGRCTLSGRRGAASCAVSFTPGRTQSGTPTLTARYAGDFGHTGSSGSTTVSPVAGMTANIAVIQGTVLISIPRHTPHAAGASGPSSSTYVPLKGGGTIPVGSTVDATNGTVMLATAADSTGRSIGNIGSRRGSSVRRSSRSSSRRHSSRRSTATARRPACRRPISG